MIDICFFTLPQLPSQMELGCVDEQLTTTRKSRIILHAAISIILILGTASVIFDADVKGDELVQESLEETKFQKTDGARLVDTAFLRPIKQALYSWKNPDNSLSTMSSNKVHNH